MNCHRNIVAFIQRLPQDSWFATRQVLEFGSREAVDQSLYRLVKCGFLLRIARGVFTLSDDRPKVFEPLAVASFKASAFRKSVAVHGLDIAKKLGLVSYTNDDPTFCVHGVSSSFQSVEMKICLQNFSARKTALGDSPLGQVIRALWFLGKDRCDSQAVQAAMAMLNSDEIQELTSSPHLMPGWLTKIVRYANGWQPESLFF
ncbi:type IV toxin-antitoxin system AbiEi family antitoxin domain-containing protein [bacterium]|nr:type IV toxin-antitoxin system AbiEi family antitoxin domain-containing protein [bacterium]MBP9809698.1 type IV toxin-antitoxin system AbiEi family antitoxin domain-containing protein [bacterium]